MTKRVQRAFGAAALMLGAMSLGAATTLGIAWWVALRAPVLTNGIGPRADGDYRGVDGVVHSLVVATSPSRGAVIINASAGKMVGHWDRAFQDASTHREVDPRAIVPWGLASASVPWVTGDAKWPGSEETQSRTILARGWPMLAVWCECRWNPDMTMTLEGGVPLPERFWESTDWGARVPRGLPFRPVWSGFIIDAAAYGVGWVALLLAARGVTRWRRMRAGECTGCGYSLGGLSDNVCPECGARGSRIARDSSVVRPPGGGDGGTRTSG